MFYNTSPERMTEALANAQLHWRQANEGKAQGKAAFTIALSRESGTYGAAVARQVGERLGWPVYDSELLQRIADDLGVRRSLLDNIDERQRGWLEERLAGLFVASEVSEFAYFRHLLETILSLAKIGSCVIVGRGATKALPLATTLRVRVIAPLEHRITAVSREHGISREAAAERIQTTDRNRNRFVKDHFKMDPADPTNYDLLLNAERFTVAECADLVIAGLERVSGRPASSASTSQKA
jgi:cytidylate kinase